MNCPICRLQPIAHHAAAFTHNDLAATSWQAGQTAKICVNDLTGNRLKSRLGVSPQINFLNGSLWAFRNKHVKTCLSFLFRSTPWWLAAVYFINLGYNRVWYIIVQTVHGTRPIGLMNSIKKSLCNRWWIQRPWLALYWIRDMPTQVYKIQ